MHVSVSVYKEVLNTYLSFLDAKLKASLHNKVGIVTAGSRQFGKAARFAELYGMMKPAVHIMVGSKEHDNMEKALIDVEHVKNAPIQGRFTDAFEKERGMSINESMAKDNSIMITVSPKMTASTPLDKYGQPLELPKSKYHK
jgi:hypothetical protein